jgi:hypothetical protein
VSAGRIGRSHKPVICKKLQSAIDSWLGQARQLHCHGIHAHYESAPLTPAQIGVAAQPVEVGSFKIL